MQRGVGKVDVQCGDIRRFPTAGHYAHYNATARRSKRHQDRTSGIDSTPAGTDRLNHALHIATVTQVRNDTPGRAYYLRKQTEGKTKKEALRALKRRISDAVYHQLLADTTS